MRQGNIALHPYLESNLLEQIHKTVGVVLLPDEKGYMPPADEGLVKEEVGEVEEDLRLRLPVEVVTVNLNK